EIGEISLVESLTTTSYQNYYSKDINFTYTSASDDDTYIDNYILYIVPVSDIDSYDQDYELKEETDNNSILEITIDTNQLDDGNYFAVIDAKDIAGNYVQASDVISTKRNIYIDNTIPDYNLNLGTIASSTVYVSENAFEILLALDDDGSNINENTSITKMIITRPNNSSFEKYYNSSKDGLYCSEADLGNNWQDLDIFKISARIKDNVDNNLNLDFNIIVDLGGPSLPGAPTLTISPDFNVGISWTASSGDSASGLAGYKVYRGDTDFTAITTQTLICSTAVATRTCTDTSDKSDDKRYYYGVIAYDVAGNNSNPVTSSIKTGPELSFTVADSNEFVNDSTPLIEIETSSDVNQVRFSCNGSSFTSWIEVTDTDFNYSSFNIASSSNGCNDDDGDKKLYVEAQSEDTDLYTLKYEEFYFDSHAPTKPLNVKINEQTNGSIKLSWDESEDENTTSDIIYRIYYSDSNSVSATSSFKESETTTYTFSPNEEKIYYFRISALDEAGNQSALTDIKSGDAKRFGPKFTMDINNSNTFNSQIYVGKGLHQITFTSDEDLLTTPTIRLKIGSLPYVNLVSTFVKNIVKTSYDFNNSGSCIIEITGKNKLSQEAIDSFNVIADSNLPVFDFNYTLTGSIYDFNITNLPSDCFRVQYLLNNTTEICMKENVTNYNCAFDSNSTADASYKLNIVSYDHALNTYSKTIDLVINNVDEYQLRAKNLKEELTILLKDTEDKINLFEGLLVVLPTDTNSKLNSAKEKFGNGNIKFLENQFNLAENLYLESKKLILEIASSLPSQKEIKKENFNLNYDANLPFVISNYVSDANILKDSKALYDSNAISFSRDFTVQEISSKKYFSVNLIFKNNSNKAITLTIIEDIPKSFANNISNLVFSKKVDIINKDPVIRYTVTIPASSSDVFRYNKKGEITDFDSVTKFNSIKFNNPIILAGDIPLEKIKAKNNSNLLGIILFSLLIIIVILILASIFLGIKKQKEEALDKISISTKAKMNDYFSKDKKVTSGSNDTINTDISSLKSDKSTFDSNYEYILDAIKKR
ncbi:MAG: fibronectin type III domain-containing protein, partial [archaeon]